MIILLDTPTPFEDGTILQSVMVLTEPADMKPLLPVDLELCNHSKEVTSPEVSCVIFYLSPVPAVENGLRIERITEWCGERGVPCRTLQGFWIP